MHSQQDIIPSNSNQHADEQKSVKKENVEDREVNNSSFNGNRPAPSKDTEKDSLGLLQANQQAISQTLDLNQEPLSSLYTGAPAAPDGQRSK